MIASRHLVLAVAFGAACAGAQAPSPGVPGGRAPAGAGAISGIVVNHQGVRLPEQIVGVGGRRTISDGEGRFSLADVPATYDLIVAKPDGDLVTIYQGISRRDLRVVHTPKDLTTLDRRSRISALWVCDCAGRRTNTIRGSTPPRRFAPSRLIRPGA